MRLFLGSVFSEGRKRFNDTFNRTDTTTGLGTASDGSLWTALRGNMNVSANTATSTDSPSTYPAATVKMPAKGSNTITLQGADNGSGSVLWATDSGNWWATDIYQYTYSTTNYYNYATGNYYCGYGQCFTCNAYRVTYTTNVGVFSTNYTSGPFCDTWNSSNIHTAQYCTHYYYTVSSTYAYGYTSVASGTECARGDYNCCAPGPYADYATGSVTTTYYPKYIRVLQSVSNTVSQIASQYLGDSTVVQSLKTIISGNQVTVKAFSDANAVTQVGTDLVYSATGATVTPQFGLVITPSGYNQGATIDAITIE